MDSVTLDFVAYAKNLAQDILPELQTLRAQATDGPTRRDVLARIFRQTHSLKGLAQAAGQEQAASLAHELESALAALCVGQSQVSESLLGWLENSVAAIAGSLDANQAVPNRLPIQRPAFSAPKKLNESFALPAELAESLNEFETQRLREAFGEGLNIFSLIIGLELFSFDESLRALTAAISGNGEILATQPLGQEPDTGYLRFRLLIATRAGQQAILAFCEPYGPTVVEKVTLSVPARHLLAMLAQAGRSVAQESGKQIMFEVRDSKATLSGDLSETLFAPLLHLVRNAVGHGCETPAERLAAGKPEVGHIGLSAQAENEWLIFSVSDDGRGICPEKLTATAQAQGFNNSAAPPLDLIFQPGFTTSDSVSRLSGRGIGLDVVQQFANNLGGRVEVTSEAGCGTTFTLFVPLNTTR